MNLTTGAGALLAAVLIALLWEANQRIGALVLALVVIALLSRAVSAGQIQGAK